MSRPETIFADPRAVAPGTRALAGIAVASARLLAMLPPRQIRSILTWLRRRARPATPEQALDARDTVVKVSLSCAGPEGCLARSLATVVLCRMRGQWATWCVGVRRSPPFTAHAWVEVDGSAISEPYPPDYFRKFFTVP